MMVSANARKTLSPANASLITAAPELLDACEAALVQLEIFVANEADHSIDEDDACIELRAAISKAKPKGE